MRSLIEQLAQYAAYHRDRCNIATHFVGIPMIVLALCIFLSPPAFAAFGAVLSPVIVVAAIVAIFYRLMGGRRSAFDSSDVHSEFKGKQFPGSNSASVAV